MRSLRSILAAGLLSASLLFPNQIFSDKKVVFNETYPIPMIYEYGDSAGEENINIQASVDQQTNTIYFGIYTRNYNKYWSDKSSKFFLPISEQYTSINHTYSEILLLRPSRVKIEEQTQRIYRVPQHDWYSELQPYEKAQTFQLILETMKKAVDKITSKIPFLNSTYDKYLEDAAEKKKEHYDKILEENAPDYVITNIAPYIPKQLVGYTETAREYSITFDIGNTQDEIPLYLWLRIDLGDSSIAGPGCFPNRYGKLENILIKFILNENNVTRDELNDYFLHGDELKSINIAEKKIEGTNSNPAIITISSMGYGERMPYEEDKVVRIGIAEYIIKGDEDSAEKDLSWGIVQFNSPEDRKIFMQKKESLLKYPLFVKDNILSYIEKPTIEKVTSPVKEFSEQQYIIYGDLILNYSKRTGMEVMLDKDQIKSQGLLKQIENY